MGYLSKRLGHKAWNHPKLSVYFQTAKLANQSHISMLTTNMGKF